MQIALGHDNFFLFLFNPSLLYWQKVGGIILELVGCHQLHLSLWHLSLCNILINQMFLLTLKLATSKT